MHRITTTVYHNRYYAGRFKNQKIKKKCWKSPFYCYFAHFLTHLRPIANTFCTVFFHRKDDFKFGEWHHALTLPFSPLRASKNKFYQFIDYMWTFFGRVQWHETGFTVMNIGSEARRWVWVAVVVLRRAWSSIYRWHLRSREVGGWRWLKAVNRGILWHMSSSEHLTVGGDDDKSLWVQGLVKIWFKNLL